MLRHRYTVTVGWYKASDFATVHTPVCSTRIWLWAWIVYLWYDLVSLWGPVVLYRDNCYVRGSKG